MGPIGICTSISSAHAKAEAAEIKAREEALKRALIAKGATEAEGVLFRATVSGPSWCSSHSEIGTVITVRSRKGIALPVAA
jgi:hypothetical protein